MKLTEDDIYRRSTQYLHWSFTAAQLAAQRLQTNIQAAERVKAALARHRAARALKAETPNASGSEAASQNGGNTPLPSDREVTCLTVAEEQRVVDHYCEQALGLGQFLETRIEVAATGIQYMRRFYLLNSPMTYDPQTISRTAMYMAMKTEGHHNISVADYSSKLAKTTPEDILAPEFLITQALRFHYEVRHPFRGLKGGHLEIMEMARGKPTLPPNIAQEQTPQALQKAMLQLPRKPNGPAKVMTQSELERRVSEAYGFASHILKTAALLTDAYFLYTPSHIWLSAHLLADEPLTLLYLSTKSPPSHPTHAKLLSTLRACAALLSSHHTFHPANQTPEEKAAREQQEKAEMSAIFKKMRQCRNPDKTDLVKLNQAQKRDAVNDGELEENKRKRRKVAREQYEKEADDFWGPQLPKKEGVGNGNGSGNGNAMS